MSNQAIDLTFVSNKELIDELVKRHDGLVVAGIKFTTQNNFLLTKHWSGNHFLVLGILEDMKHQVNKNGDKNFTLDN
jgi:hypothetical protein